MAHWQTAQKFTTGREVLRVYNPNLEQHGWHSDHTVVEIVNDDMPFLVDSVTMAVNRLGLAMHSAIHPVFRVSRDASGAITRIALGHVDGSDPQSRLESFCAVTSRACSVTYVLPWKTGRRSSRSRVRPSVK
jgi:glutamate dehydrogenase